MGPKLTDYLKDRRFGRLTVVKRGAKARHRGHNYGVGLGRMTPLAAAASIRS